MSSDVAYGKPMSYRAVPLAALLVGLNPPPDSVIESVALDGFAAQLPLDLLTNADPAKAVAWLAIEPADMPWPPLPGKAASAGPFYIVWTGATRVRPADQMTDREIDLVINGDSAPNALTRICAMLQ